MKKHLQSAVLCVAGLVVILALCRCCSARYNQPLTNPQPPKIDTTSDSTLMYACFSGGGTRAMAMGYYVVDALSKIKYGCHTLRDEIDYTSGVSGGAFVSAALIIYPQDEWSEFYKRGVARDIQGTMIKKILEVWNWPRLLSPYYTRTDMAAEFYDRRVFKRKTLGDLPVRPHLLINTTILAARTHFVFTDEYFKYINSDISVYPVGFACAASSAFPVGFAPMTLKNYNTYTSEEEMLKYPKYQYAVDNEQTDIEQHAFADMYRFLKDTTNKWIHIADGGIAGNTGIERVLDGFRTNGVINKAINDTKHPLKRLIMVVVNAGTEAPDESCSKRSSPIALKVVLYTTTSAMDILSEERTAMLKARVDELWGVVQQAKGRDPALANLERPYLIEINARNLTNKKLKKEFDKIPTSFDLPKDQLETIRSAVSELMEDNTELNRLKESLRNDK